LVLMVGGALVIGMAWPWAVQRLRAKPSAASVELAPIDHNIAATRHGFDIAGVRQTPYPGGGLNLVPPVAVPNQVRILDPNRLSPTFNVKQQVQGYYAFKSTLDIDHYVIDHNLRDVAIAVRELNVSGLPSGRKTWANTHLVYTHGYGVVAAPTDDMPEGLPDFVEGNLPPTGPLNVTTPQIYYGQMSPSYSIVGGPKGGTPKEFDRPNSDGAGPPINTTYRGGGGVPIGSFLHRLEYAWKLHSASVLFSSDINSDSKLLTVRNPRSRVAAVAPWLTLDGDVYPAVVDGHVDWVVDGYTTSNSYPDSQRVNLRGATSNTLTQGGATVTQPNRSINYIRNSVKATVDAYTGQVTLYAWNQASDPDPILQSWNDSFPGLIQPQSTMPPSLLLHLRYPQDLFNIQRSVLTRYHVTDPAQFYAGSDFWKVPTDPTVAAQSRLNAVGKTVSVSPPAQPSVYLTMSADGQAAARFSVSSPLTTLNRRNLAAFLSVDAEPGSEYGKFSLLQLPATGSVESPSQIQNDIESDSKIAHALTLSRGGNSRVVLGNLLAIPYAGQMLYVEPIYTRAAGNASFPILSHVVAIYGNGKPVFAKTLASALRQVLPHPARLPAPAQTP